MFHTWQQFKSIYSEVMKKILFITLSTILSAPTFGADGNHRANLSYGNMVMDKNKGISSISYDINNLPQKILYNDGRKASYVYDAEGNKHSVLYTLTAMTNALPQMPVMQSADAVKTGREIKSLTYGTYDYPGSIYQFNLIKKLSNHINVWKK